MRQNLTDRRERIELRQDLLREEQKRFDCLLREVGEKHHKLDEKLEQLRETRRIKTRRDADKNDKTEKGPQCSE